MRLVVGSMLFVTACSASSAPANPPPMCTPASLHTTFAPAASAAPAPRAAETDLVKSPEEAIAQLFTSKKIEAAWFTSSFADAVPPQKVESIVRDVVKEIGPFVRVEKDGEAYAVVCEQGKMPAKIGLDGDKRIASLWFSPADVTTARPLPEIEKALAALPGKVSYLVVTDGKDVVAREAETPMAVGSAFKLAILDALREKIDAKKAKWSDVVALQAKHKSLPSGSLQTWPDKAPITLHTLASLMISVSDNTATDALLDYVGRENAEKRAPTAAPFMSTREAFVLKAKSNAAMLARWRAGDPALRRTMLPEIDGAKLGEDVSNDPSLDVEWHISARNLCTLLSKNKDLDITHINPGVAKAKDWDLVAYKGGSEAGVINLSTWVEKAGKKSCVVTTWNDEKKDVDTPKLLALHGALLRSVR